jgi:DNA invertase Pin-like site-specific DNA recombinase
MKDTQKITALYCRLSKDDEREGESLSIDTQRSMLLHYAKEAGLMPTEVYIDDGYSGLNFDRPGFNRMLDDIVDGKVATVITKDLSRLGRDHLTVGHYTEIYFPTHNVRYIAINDGVDTANSNSNDFAALKNVINEFYSRDTSRKIRAANTTRAREGKYRCTIPPFGYIKDPVDHNHLIPDPEVAHHIPKIFELCAQGWGNYRLRDWLRTNKVPCPSWLHHERGWIDKAHMFPTEESRYLWRPDSLRLLLRNQVYMGDTVNGKSKVIFKTKKHPRTDESEWIVVRDTHEPLVSRELWHRANELVSVKRQEAKENLTGQVNLFKGLIKCADCDKALTRRKYGNHSKHWIYCCTAYCTYGKHRCSQHKIFEDDLIAAVLADIQDKAKGALSEKNKLVERLVASSLAEQDGEQRTRLDTHNKAVKRLREIEQLVARLYEDSITGTITAGNFSMLITKYQNEQKQLQVTVADFENTNAETIDSKSNAEKCAALLADNAGITELTTEVLNTLISRIDVYETEVVDGIKRQRIDIHYRFAGVIEPCEYQAQTFYKTDGVKAVSRKRQSWKEVAA